MCPVRLLRVEEEALVEGADLVQGFGPQEEHGSDDELGARAQAVQAAEAQAAQAQAAEAQAAQAQRLAPGAAWAREGPADAGGDTGVVHLGGADAREVHLGPQRRLEGLHAGGGDAGVRVEEEHVRAGCAVRQRHVDAGREPAVSPRVAVPHAQGFADRGDLGEGGVVHHGHGQVGQRLQGAAHQRGRTVGHEHYLQAGGLPREPLHALVEGAVLGGHRVPAVLGGAGEPGLPQLRGERRVAAHAQEGGAKFLRVPRGDEQPHAHLGQGPAGASHHGHAAGHGLNSHAPELLLPPRGRQGGHREDVEGAVEGGQLSGAEGAGELDAAGQAEVSSERPQLGVLRATAREPQGQ